ncbi:type VI lipase adapter Tla3 domain-containing protein [Pseudomonas putida]|uniref:DUF2875 domain-containing protein n=1 Tax=Pseudomonas putida TaxID=303 RepID=A0A1X0ZQQ6_PSEPU|nr:DUF2875 family protein [Pseudomonas putida]ORL61601.1 hypothetical protein B7H17_20240 [Pseudomonas putida]
MAYRSFAPLLALGISSVLGVVALIFGFHLWFKALADEKENQAAYKREILAALAEQESAPPHTFALEIRGAGVAIHRDAQSRIWKFIKDKNDNFSSVYSVDPKDYPDSLTSRRISSEIKVRLAFKQSAGESVAYWPIPVFALGPPNLYDQRDMAALLINAGRNAATLGVTLFLWQDDENTSHAQTMIERLFIFFDGNPTVPQALIVSEDGDVVRNLYRKPGTPGLDSTQVVPTIYESMAGLLVARSDRVDRYLRFSAVDEPENNQSKKTDLGKLWAFYWEQSRAFDKWYEEIERSKGSKFAIAPTMSTAYWHSKLPELWKTISNRGPGHFEPSPWLPVRWAQHQVDEFDASPVLGYLHRPIKVPMHDENGKRLKPALQAKALQAGWLEALDTLPKGHKPVRVFYDTTDNLEAEIALTNALHELNTDGHGLDIGNVEEGYDIGRRLGNTGVSSALVQINLASIASYLDGGTSAVVYAGADGSLTVQMVRPPDEARKEKNRQNRGVDPFNYGLP